MFVSTKVRNSQFLSLTPRKYSYSGGPKNQIIRVNDLSQIIKLISQLDRNALVAFDVDKTLIVRRDKLATDIHFVKIQNMIRQICNDSDRVNLCHSMIYLQTKKEIIDGQSVDLIKNLNQNEIKTIALTALSRGSFGAIPDVLRWRIDELNELGYRFDTGFDPNFCFQFKNEVTNALPAFKKGVLFTSTLPKGGCLEDFP